MKKDKIILYSGGLDSTVLLHKYRDSIKSALSFEYGSNHNAKELSMAEYNCKKLVIEHIVFSLNFMKNFKSSLLEGADKIPTGNYNKENMKSTVVPFRNGIMLSIAGGLAESKGIEYILIANHAGDHEIYPDCRETFIQSMNNALVYGTYNNTSILSDFNNMTKSDIVKIGQALNVDFSKTWSCYKGDEKHCGGCGTCIERKRAFEKAKIRDETEYV